MPTAGDPTGRAFDEASSEFGEGDRPRRWVVLPLLLPLLLLPLLLMPLLLGRCAAARSTVSGVDTPLSMVDLSTGALAGEGDAVALALATLLAVCTIDAPRDFLLEDFLLEDMLSFKLLKCEVAHPRTQLLKAA